MGLFSKKTDYPELEPGNPAAEKIQEVETQLKEFVAQVSDPIEVVPTEGQAYLFIGKPPKKFGMAWIEGGAVRNFVAAAKERGLGQTELLKINERLRDAYKENMDAQRYKTEIGGKEVVVIPCMPLAREVDQITGELRN